MAFDHAHVGARSVERHQLVGEVRQPRVVVSRHRYEGVEQRKAAGTACEACGDVRQAEQATPKPSGALRIASATVICCSCSAQTRLRNPDASATARDDSG